MELRHLHYFKTVAEELHFTKASEKLFIAQPPLSRQIKELEDELGVKLFERNNKRVSLTEPGKYFKEEVDGIFKKLEEAKNRVKQIEQNENGELKIGYISSVYQSDLSEVLKEMNIVYPFVKTSLFEAPTVKQVEDLEKGNLDVGILRAPVNSEKLKVKTLFIDPFVIITPKSISNFKSIDELVQDIRDLPFIFFNKSYAPFYYGKLIEICERLGFKPSIQHEVNNVHSILQLVEAGLGVSILPKSLEKQYKKLDVQFIPLPDIPINTEIVLAYKESKVNQVARWFIKKYGERF
jgi:DNA-binding transcriptional LysR family regulator